MLLTSGEIKRTRARFVLLTLGAGGLVFLLLFCQLLLDGVLNGLTGAMRHQSGAVVVFSAESGRNLPSSTVPPADVQAAIKADPMVGAASDLVFATIPFRSAKGTDVKDAMVFGYHDGLPGMPEKSSLVAGRFPAAPGEVLADRESAAGWYELGGTVVIEPGGRELTVVGLTEDTRTSVSSTFWLPYDEFVLAGASGKALLPTQPQVMVLQPAENVTPRALAAQLRVDHPDLDIVTRQVAADSTPGLNQVRVAFGMILALFYLVVGIVVGFFFLTLTLQKKPSITLLRAVGAPNAYLVRSLIQQVLIVTLGGMAVGLALLFTAVAFGQTEVPLVPKISTIGFAGGMAMTVALLGAIPPMRRILRTDPYDVVGRPGLGGLG